MIDLSKVSGEFGLTAFAYNLTRAITIVGVPAMMKAAYSRTAGIYPPGAATFEKTYSTPNQCLPGR